MSAHPEIDLPRFEGPVRGVAKYELLRRELASAIEEGRIPPGAQLPPELTLAARTGVSLGTVQRALRELETGGYVVRRQGSGTFVLDRGKRMEEPLHCRFTAEDDDASAAAQPASLPVYTRVLDRALVEGPGPWRDALGHGSEGVVRLDRRISVGGRFSVASRLYMRANRYGRLMNLPQGDLDGRNIKKLLYQEFGVAIVRITQRMRVAPVPPEVAAWMDAAPGALVLAIRAVGFDPESRPVYYQELWVPPTAEELLLDIDVEP